MHFCLVGADGLPSLKLAAELVNVFDTSSHYENESFLGPVLGESSLREEFILCTKVGHVRGEPPKGAVPIKGDDWHCIEPSFVEAEVRACKERLGTVPDIVFLHNPEYMLSARLKQQVPIADAWDEMYQAHAPLLIQCCVVHKNFVSGMVLASCDREGQYNA